MKKLILGATGSIGSSLAKKIVNDGGEVHLVGRDEASLSNLAKEMDATYTTCNVLEEDFSEKIFNDLGDSPINGLAYCVGSIDLKPIKITKKSDYMQSFNLNLISAVEDLIMDAYTNGGLIIQVHCWDDEEITRFISWEDLHDNLRALEKQEPKLTT